MEKSIPTPEEFERLVSFLPILYGGGIDPVRKWHGGVPGDDGIIQWPWPEYDETVLQFFSIVESEFWTDPNYTSQNVWQLLRENESVIESADIDLLKSILTWCARGERFAEGHWNVVIESGIIRRILERLAKIGDIDIEKYLINSRSPRS